MGGFDGVVDGVGEAGLNGFEVDRREVVASDTLRPFAITMAPVWAASIAAGRTLMRHRS